MFCYIYIYVYVASKPCHTFISNYNNYKNVEKEIEEYWRRRLVMKSLPYYN